MDVFRKKQITPEDFDKVCQHEWEKAIKKLKNSTPKGQIRFTLLNYGKLKRKLMHQTKIPNTDALLHNFVVNMSSEPNFYLTFSFQNFPPYISEAETMDVSIYYRSNPLYEVLLVFYANDLESNPNCAKDLITYWFENFVLPLHKKFKNTAVPQNLPLACYPITKTYSYTPLTLALHSLGYSMNSDQYKEILNELCEKNNCRLHSPDIILTNTISLY